MYSVVCTEFCATDNLVVRLIAHSTYSVKSVLYREYCINKYAVSAYFYAQIVLSVVNSLYRVVAFV